jgi:hypothetical protein
MKPIDDVKLAEEALAALKRLRSSNVGAALKELGSLAPKVRNTHPDQGELRHDAFMAVQKLRQELTRDPNFPASDALWSDAIAKTEAWHQWLSS